EAGPAGERGDLCLAVAGAELELVRQAAGVEEVRGVALDLLLRALGLHQQEGVVPHEAAVERGIELLRAERRAALGHQLEAAVDLRVEAGQIEVAAEDLRVLDLVGGRGVAELALVPGGLLRAGGTGVAADLHLVAVEVPAGGRVRRGDLTVDLAVGALESG